MEEFTEEKTGEGDEDGDGETGMKDLLFEHILVWS